MTSIVSSDILFKLSAPNASAGNTQSGVAGLSWGGFVSTTVLSNISLDNLFQDITGPENVGLQVDYACLFIHNNTASGNAMLNTIVWLPSTNVTVGGATVAIALDPTGATSLTATTQQAVKISSSTVPPSGVTGWVGPSSTTSGGLTIGTILPGQVYPVWFQRTATNSVAVTGDGCRIEVSFGSN